MYYDPMVADAKIGPTLYPLTHKLLNHRFICTLDDFASLHFFEQQNSFKYLQHEFEVTNLKQRPILVAVDSWSLAQ